MNAFHAILLGIVLGIGMALAGCRGNNKAPNEPAPIVVQEGGQEPVVLPFSETTDGQPPLKADKACPTSSSLEASCSSSVASSPSSSIGDAELVSPVEVLGESSWLSALWSSLAWRLCLLGLALLACVAVLCYSLFGRFEAREPSKPLSPPSRKATQAPAVLDVKSRKS